MSKTAVINFGTNWIMQLDDPAKKQALGWTSKLHVDADGSPHAYHPATGTAPTGSPPALDYLANAGKPGNWWGIACDSGGKPYIQKENDPAPGFYVSTTALMDQTPVVKASSPQKYVNSEKVPFIVLPSSPKFSASQKLGDLCVVFNNKNGKSSWAIYADIGPKNAIGEGSMALCDALGLSNSPKSGGTEEEIIATIYFPGSIIGWPRPNDELSAKAWELFNTWGAYLSAKDLLPQINWTQFAPPPPPKEPPKPLA